MGKEAARRAFSATRKLRGSGLLKHTYRLYLAHASIELHVNDEPEVARRVFEHGLSQHESFIREPEYVVEYINFLMQVRPKDTGVFACLRTHAATAVYGMMRRIFVYVMI